MSNKILVEALLNDSIVTGYVKGSDVAKIGYDSPVCVEVISETLFYGSGNKRINNEMYVSGLLVEKK